MVLPKDFVSEKHFDKLTGVYFPYWYVDEQRSAQMVAKGEKVRSWTVGDDRYTETKVFELHRAGNLIVNNVFERALKGQDRDMLQCVHPYDLGEAHPFAMSYLSGFQAEKRDIEQNEVAQAVQTRINGYCQQLMKDTASGYSAVQIQNYNDKIDLENWNYTLLPVWVVTYKYRGKILPFAVNGQTGKPTVSFLPPQESFLLSLQLLPQRLWHSACWEVCCSYDECDKKTFRNACGNDYGFLYSALCFCGGTNRTP